MQRCLPGRNVCCHCSLLFAAILVLENRDLRDAIKPQGVRFYSLNFNNTLRWLPGRAGEGETTLYFVQYKVYGQSKWQNKEECWGIQSHFCDLTEETSDAYEAYYGRVQAASTDIRSDWSLSCRFTPWRETMIGPPTIKVVHSNKFVVLKLRAPRSAYKRKRGSMIPMTNYYDLLYQVFIINNLLDEVPRRKAHKDTCDIGHSKLKFVSFLREETRKSSDFEPVLLGASWL
ncbi:interleukin-22 receptor subunit alpha-2 isoform X2 [Meleagris gallopavo]|uniref:interleukin-22 receptor subunit alpha-2 isoform X2 n=1 Tax=Meleagris gallopavo TaxID=9103 RepID=UPI000549DDFC|nr:interleukin-22 receptor subunit alpha-2 isoform X2 [Meleagris gallopavo]